MIHENIELSGSLSVSGSFNLPLYASSTDYPSPKTGSMYNDTTDNVAKIYTGTEWVTVGEQVTPVLPYSADFLVLGGGAGGGRDRGGGGGAGGLRTSYGDTSGRGSSSESSITLTPPKFIL